MGHLILNTLWVTQWELNSQYTINKTMLTKDLPTSKYQNVFGTNYLRKIYQFSDNSISRYVFIIVLD